MMGAKLRVFTPLTHVSLESLVPADHFYRHLDRTFDLAFVRAYLDRVRGYHETEAYKKAMRKRGVWVEPLFAEAKSWHGLRRFQLRGLLKVNGEALLTAGGQNLKRLLSRAGWGRRPYPGGAIGLAMDPAFVGVVG